MIINLLPLFIVRYYYVEVSVVVNIGPLKMYLTSLHLNMELVVSLLVSQESILSIVFELRNDHVEGIGFRCHILS